MSILINSLKASKSGFFYQVRCAMARKFGKSFRDAERFTADQFRAYQQEQFERMVRHCVENVPYYRQRNNLYIRNGQAIPLNQMPVISKQEFRNHTSMFYADRGVGYCRYHKTSGTSGTPLLLKASHRTHSMVTAGLLRQRNLYGLRLPYRTACLTGFFNPAKATSQEIAWRDYIGSRLFLSVYQVSDSRVSEYAELLDKFKPDEFFGYASSLYLLSQAFQKKQITPPKSIKLVATTSEVIYPEWRACIQQTFGAPVADQYGSQELQCLVTECPCGTMHINPEFGIVEVVDDDFRSVPAGQEGQLLLTGLANDAMPLIRYQIGDQSATVDMPDPCACGLCWPAIQPVSGRSDDAILTPDGRRLRYIIFHCIKGVKGIVESQFIQDGPDHIKILLVVDAQYTPSSEASILSTLRQRAQYDFKVDVEYVESIPRGSRGKFRTVVNLLNKEQGKVT